LTTVWSHGLKDKNYQISGAFLQHEAHGLSLHYCLSTEEMYFGTEKTSRCHKSQELPSAGFNSTGTRFTRYTDGRAGYCTGDALDLYSGYKVRKKEKKK
jgi:hypothetical protein